MKGRFGNCHHGLSMDIHNKDCCLVCVSPTGNNMDYRPEPKSSGTINVNLVYAGQSKPKIVELDDILDSLMEYIADNQKPLEPEFQMKMGVLQFLI